MNEVLFFIQILFIIGFAIWALKLGLRALTTWVTIQDLIANLFVVKQIVLFGFDVTAGDAFVIGGLLGLNFIQEYFSQEEAQKATWICFFCLFFFIVVSQLHLMYEPSSYDMTQGSFNTILSLSPRLLIASMSVFLIVQQVDIRFFSFLKSRFPQLSFSLRTAISLILSQFLDTVLFSYAGLYGVVVSIVDIILVSYFIKLIVIFCFTPLIKWAKI